MTGSISVLKKLVKENVDLKKRSNALLKTIENQIILIDELRGKIAEIEGGKSEQT